MNKFNQLNWLLNPELDDKGFFNQIYEKQYFLIERNNQNYYSDKLNEVALQDLLELAASLSVLIKLVKAGQSAPVSFPLPINELLKYLQDGYTIVLYSMDKYNPSIQNLCKSLGEKFQCPIKANMYITPPQSQGLSPHYDCHDVMVLQLFGRKEWKIYSREVEKPVIFQLVGGLKPKTTPNKLDITAGDLLYLPRGYVHKASAATDSFSIHLTLGIHVNTWYAFFDEILKSITVEDVTLREAMDEITSEPRSQEKIKKITDLVCKKLNNPSLQKKVLENYLRDYS